MKQNISFRLPMVFTVLMLLFSGNLLFAQSKDIAENNWEENISVAYNTPFSYTLDNDVNWELKNNGKLIQKGTGNIDNQIFSKPGTYTLYIKENHSHTPNSCDHTHFPSKLNIKVSPMKMVFDLSSVKFSENITGGRSAKGITVTVNADYSSFDNKISKYNGSFKTFGVGSTITGKLKSGETTLKQGTNTLEFVLDGQATKGNNIQLNFVDVNGLVQPYGLTQIIQ